MKWGNKRSHDAGFWYQQEKNEVGQRMANSPFAKSQAPPQKTEPQNVDPLEPVNSGQPGRFDTSDTATKKQNIGLKFLKSGQLKKSFSAVKNTILTTFARLSRKQLMWGASGVFVLLLIAVGLTLLNRGDNSANNPAKNAAATAKFNPLVPFDTKTNMPKTLGVSTCPERQDTICFNDTFFSSNLRISQQKLPAEFVNNPAKLKEVAEGLKGAGQYEVVSSSKGTGYVISYKDIKTQRVVYATANQLIFIQSEKTLDADTWKQYFETLSTSK